MNVTGQMQSSFNNSSGMQTQNMMNNYYNTPPATSGGPTGGTSILALKGRQQPQQSQQLPQYHSGYQIQHPNYPQEQDTLSQGVESDEADNQSHYSIKKPNLKNIVNDINDAIDEEQKSKKNNENNDTEEEEEEEDDNNDKIEDVEQDKSKYVKMLKDPLLLWGIYMLLSQNFIKNIIGNYVTSINPGKDGSVGIIGVATYGLVLVVTYFVLRYIFI